MELVSCPRSPSSPSPPTGKEGGEGGEGEEGGEGGEGQMGEEKEKGRSRLISTVRGRVSLSRGPCHRSVDVALEVQGFDSQGRAVPGTRHVGLYPFAMSD